MVQVTPKCPPAEQRWALCGEDRSFLLRLLWHLFTLDLLPSFGGISIVVSTSRCGAVTFSLESGCEDP
eukprot:scaffold878_cov271-Pinguiococcus_pyrenoidosus.AAC.37